MTRRHLLYTGAALFCIVRFMLHLLVSQVSFSGASLGWRRAVLAAASEKPFVLIVLAASSILLLVTLWFLVKLSCGSLVTFLSERESTAILLVSGFAWSVPMILGPGALLHDDWGPQLRAALLALDSFRAMEIPAWSFVFGNGISYTLQYPPLATLVVASVAYVTHLPMETCFKLTCVLMHGLFIAGGYRFARALRIDRLAAASGVLIVALTQQYWVFFVHGAMPSLIASSLLPTLLFALVRTVQTGSPKFVALLGCTVGWIAMAQPVTALFATYTILLALLVVVIRRPPLAATRARALVCGGIGAILVSAPYVSSILLFRKYNQFQFSALSTGFYFPPLTLARWLWWSPRLGWPPGVGSDNSGYVGIAIAVANVVAIVVALRTRTLMSRLYLGCLAWGMALVYGTRLGVFKILPFGYLAKGTHRLWPFLAVALMLGVSIALGWLFKSRRYALALILIVFGSLENALFSLRPAFHQPNDEVKRVLESIPEDGQTASFLVFLEGKENSRVSQSIYREISLARRPDLYYLHHEETGIVGTRYWQLFGTIASARPDTDWRRAEAELRWFRIQYLIVVGRSAADYGGLGPGVTNFVDGIPVTVIPIEVPSPMVRESHLATLHVSTDDWRGDGSVRLPISVHPFLHVDTDQGPLNTRSENGYLSACCVPSIGVRLRVEAVHPPWLRWLWALSLACQSLTIVLLVRGRGPQAGAAGVNGKSDRTLAAMAPVGRAAS